jgi:hypothetical protein
MRLPARILCGLTFATAGHLPAQAQVSQPADSPQRSDPTQSSLSTVSRRVSSKFRITRSRFRAHRRRTCPITNRIKL